MLSPSSGTVGFAAAAVGAPQIFIRTSCISYSRCAAVGFPNKAVTKSRVFLGSQFSGRVACVLRKHRRNELGTPVGEVIKTHGVKMATMKNENDADGTSGGLRSIAAVLVVGLIFASFLPFFGSLKSSLTGSSDALVDQKLRRVPFFTVTDGTGRPFLVESDDHLSRRGYFFEDPNDAEAYLARVRADATDAKILPVGLDEALGYVLRRGSGAKGVAERFTLFPSAEEFATAREVTGGQFEETFGKTAVPLFYVDQLAFSSPDGGGTGAVYPVFFEKAALDKTLSAVKESKDAGSVSQLGGVQVIDLLQTVREIKSGGNPRLEQLAFLPMEKAVTALQASLDADAAAKK
jgi:hypothetical protein